MGNNMDKYPARCRQNIRRLTEMLNTDEQTAYAMMLLTATLSDMDPSDPEVLLMILDDCNVEVKT